MSKPLSARAIETMKPTDSVKADVSENSGLRVLCGKTGVKSFIYRYKSPETGRLTQISIGRYPDVSLSEARMEIQNLKALRRQGVCPKAEMTRKKIEAQLEAEAKAREQRATNFTVHELVEAYLTEVIEDRMVEDSRKPGVKKRVPGARKPKGQSETRRTLYGDAVKVLGEMPAREVTRKHVTDMIMSIVDRGANVQAGNVLRELTAAYDYAIGLGRFDDHFANPALLAKSSLRQARVRLTSDRGRRTLSDKELAMVLNWLPGSGFSTTSYLK